MFQMLWYLSIKAFKTNIFESTTSADKNVKNGTMPLKILPLCFRL